MTRRLLVAIVTGVGALLLLVAGGGRSEGTVVAKAEHGVQDYACHAGGIMTGPVAVPAWGSCATPACWRLVVRDGDGTTSEPCVSRAEYDSARVGSFWHGRTDR